MGVKKKKRGGQAGQRVFRPLIESGFHKGLPKCTEEGCEQPGQHTGVYRKDGSVVYRKHCIAHHAIRYNMDGGYKLSKKDYCENVDGRLGFVCTSTIIDSCQLEVDHANNKHKDNTKTNLDTLCSCCHNYKTRYFSKYKSLSEIRSVYNTNIQKFAQNTKQKRKHLV